MINDVASGKEMKNDLFSGKVSKFHAEYGGKRCSC